MSTSSRELLYQAIPALASGCPKCGHGMLATWHCDGRQLTCLNLLFFSAILRHSHMHQTCEMCGYSWVAKPHDWNEGLADPPMCPYCGQSDASMWADTECGHPAFCADHVRCPECPTETEVKVVEPGTVDSGAGDLPPAKSAEEGRTVVDGVLSIPQGRDEEPEAEPRGLDNDQPS